MKFVCAVDLDETLGHFNLSNQFIIRPYAYVLLDFFIVANIDIILWSNGSDNYVESIINKHFDIFVNNKLKTRVYGRTVCNISKHRFGYIKCSKIIRNMYNENVLLIGLDDQININMDSGYDFRIHVEPYKVKNLNDEELFLVMCKILNYCKNNILNNE